MTDSQPPNLDPEFANWYREVSIAEDRDRLSARWQGICSLSAEATVVDIDTMVRLAFRARSVPSQPQQNRVVQFFRNADALFPNTNNARELEILCAAALLNLARSELPRASAAALAVVATSCNGLRKPSLPMALVPLCETALVRLARSNRARTSIEVLKATVNSDAAAKKVVSQFDANGVAAALQLAAESTQSAVNGAFVAVQRSMLRLLQVQDEELQMLWWLIGERCIALDSAFSAVSGDAKPLVLAGDLAAMTTVSPGPPSIGSILLRGGIKGNKKTTIVDAVNDCPSNWLTQAIAGPDPSEVTSPIHFAIKRKLETNDNASWVPGWAALCQIKENEAQSALALGQQFCRERVFRTFWVAS